METRYLVVDRIPFPTTVVGATTFSTIEAAVAHQNSPTDFVVAVQDCKVRRLTPEEEMVYQSAVSRAR